MPDTTTADPAIQLPALAAEIALAGGPIAPDPADAAAVGRTTFDQASSADLTVSVLLAPDKLATLPSQALVRIESRADGRTYLGTVTAGPFAEPDGLAATSPLLTVTTIRGGGYLPNFHGRVQVTLHGEKLNGVVVPPRLRPRPNSPVFVLDDAESAAELKCGGDIRLGLVTGREAVEVGIPSDRKDVLPRHTAILGTTGGGKSNTVAGLVKRAVDAGLAVVLLDVEGEYTRLHEPADAPNIVAALGAINQAPAGVPADRFRVLHLVGRDTANPALGKPFSLQFAQLSPYAVMEVLGMPEAQQERFLKAYDIAKEVLRDLKITPQNADEEARLVEIDEFERGYPRLTLAALLDVVEVCLNRADRGPAAKPKGKKAADDDEADDADPGFAPKAPEFAGRSDAAGKIKARVHAANPPANAISWRGLKGRLGRLHRMRVFYDESPGGVKPVSYQSLLKPGTLTVVDLSDTGHSALTNLVISDLLRGLQLAQDEKAEAAERAGTPLTTALVVVEEAHEFLSKERIDKTPVLFEQVARIAKRGRKRRLGLCFVTQLPAHLPSQVLGLCNGFVLHKLTDPAVVSQLKKSVGGVDDGLWDRLPTLAPGQAVASFPHLSRPLLVSVDPAAAKLRLGE